MAGLPTPDINFYACARSLASNYRFDFGDLTRRLSHQMLTREDPEWRKIFVLAGIAVGLLALWLEPKYVDELRACGSPVRDIATSSAQHFECRVLAGSSETETNYRAGSLGLSLALPQPHAPSCQPHVVGRVVESLR